MEKSESIKELATALSKAQGEYGIAKRDCNNPFYKSKYADLTAIIAAVKESLTKNGLSFSQFPFCDGERAGVETFLFHSSGEFVSGKCSLPVVKQDPQGVGSCITYARRYALQSVLGIAAEEDDDGNAAAGISITSAVVSTSSPTPTPHSEIAKKLFISEAQRKRLFALAYQARVSLDLIKHYLSKSYQINSTDQIPVSLYNKIISDIQTGKIMELDKKEEDKKDADIKGDILEAKEKLIKAGIKPEQIQEWFSSFYHSLGYENEQQLTLNYLADWLEYLRLQLAERMKKNVAA